MKAPSQPPAVSSSVYTRDYFETCCHGHEEFAATRGQTLPLRLQIPLDLARLQPGMTVLDVGCGRGEIVLHGAWRGANVWGMDYASEAVRLTRANLNTWGDAQLMQRVAVQQASAYELPLPAESVDRVFMLDVVEHLYPRELDQALDEVYRVLRPEGLLIVHTMPNLWYYWLGYPLYRLFERLRSRRLPTNPRDRWAYKDVHVNEQHPLKLRRVLRQHGFKTQVWLETTQTHQAETNQFVRRIKMLLTQVYPFRWIFCDDIFAVGQKPV
ncbi:MAG: class I SAM-dependent methyltransferase [Anaerolineales bacterium]